MDTSTLYPIFLKIHHFLSWGIILILILAMGKAWKGVFFKNRWNGTDMTLATLTILFADIQLLTGIVLYAALSPVTRAAFNDFGAAMQNSGLRFYAAEHLAVMVLAVILLHFARAKARKAQFNARKHRISAIWYTIALLLMAVRIPWERIFS